VLRVKQESVLQGIVNTLTVISRCAAIEMNID